MSLIGARLQLDRDGSLFRKINGIDFPGSGQAISAWSNQLVMRLGLPPLEAGEEIDDVFIALEHDHRVVPTPINPTAAGIGPDVHPPPGTFASRPIGAGHRNVPS